ncbi:hypothetical protein ACFVT1_02990 [Streptomyces sp. NPDC057963]|uniref:hypothetical protein n=1 Tax=Streptomyces sp. NPDC057963 TaxID=3346290 RepID=UPI0036E9B948
MASKESTPAGESAGGSSVRRAAAIAVLTEEPTTGLFPATATATASAASTASAPASASVSPSASASAAVTASAAGAEAEATTGTKAETGGGTATATAVATATPAAEEEGAAPAAEEEAPPAAATAATGETAPATAESATAATAETASAADGTASAAQTRTTTESAAETRLTAAAGSGASGKRAVGLPLGRPKKPMIAAAVLGGLVLIGVPFLISGPDDKPRPPVAGAPAGSSMNPDGSGPGLVPSEQRISAPGVAKAKGEHSGKGPGSDGTTEHNAVLGGIHESGSGGEDKEDKPSTSKKAPSTKTGKKNTPPAESNKQTPANKPAGVAPAAPAPAITYSHLIGPGCNTPGFAAGDQYTDGNEGWRGSRGSTTSYGCSGFYYSLPMSGSSRSDGIWAQWKFTSGDVKKGNCAVQVYIPNVHDLSYVGGTPAHYTVYRAFTQSSGNQIGTFEINQPSHLGQWVSAGTFPITDNKISVVLDNRGSGANNRHAAAAPVRVNCTAT